MPTLPQLVEDDIEQIQLSLRDLLERSDATTALVIDKGGFLINHCGDASAFDLTTIAALASGSYLANQTIAQLVHEENFDSVYQQGENLSMLAVNIDEYSLLVLIFRAQISAGAVKLFALRAGRQIAAQFKIANERAPGAGLDLSILNVANPDAFFRKKPASAAA